MHENLWEKEVLQVEISLEVLAPENAAFQVEHAFPDTLVWLIDNFVYLYVRISLCRICFFLARMPFLLFDRERDFALVKHFG